MGRRCARVKVGKRIKLQQNFDQLIAKSAMELSETQYGMLEQYVRESFMSNRLRYHEERGSRWWEQ